MRRRPGVEPRSTAARTKPSHMEHLLYQLRLTEPQELLSFKLQKNRYILFYCIDYTAEYLLHSCS